MHIITGMSLSSESYLPPEVWNAIFKYIPKHEKALYLPIVCKSWMEFHSEAKKVFVLEKITNSCCGIEEKHIVEIANIISLSGLTFIPKIKSLCQMHFSKYYSSGDSLLESGGNSIRTRPKITDGFCCAKNGLDCDNFYVNWTSHKNTIKINENGRWGDFRVLFSLKMQFCDNTFEYESRHRAVSIFSDYYRPQYGGVVYWNDLCYDPYDPSRQEINNEIKLVQGLINANLDLYIELSAKLNIAVLNKIFNPISTLKNIQHRLNFQCDKRGIIIGEISNDDFNFELCLISDVNTKNGTPLKTLLWNAREVNDYVFGYNQTGLAIRQRKLYASIEQVLRWCVFARTTDKLIAKLGCATRTQV